MIVGGGERGSGISVLVAQDDDDDKRYIHKLKNEMQKILWDFKRKQITISWQEDET